MVSLSRRFLAFLIDHRAAMANKKHIIRTYFRFAVEGRMFTIGVG